MARELGTQDSEHDRTLAQARARGQEENQLLPLRAQRQKRPATPLAIDAMTTTTTTSGQLKSNAGQPFRTATTTGTVALVVLHRGYMAPVDRDYMLRVRMSDHERRQLQWLADEEGLTASDVVRQLIRRAFTDRAGKLAEAAKPKSKRK